MENRWEDSAPKHAFVVCAHSGRIVETSSTISGLSRDYVLGGSIADVVGVDLDLDAENCAVLATLGGRVQAAIAARKISDDLTFVEVDLYKNRA